MKIPASGLARNIWGKPLLRNLSCVQLELESAEAHTNEGEKLV